jgi:hypothetical protein
MSAENGKITGFFRKVSQTRHSLNQLIEFERLREMEEAKKLQKEEYEKQKRQNFENEKRTLKDAVDQRIAELSAPSLEIEEGKHLNIDFHFHWHI